MSIGEGALLVTAGLGVGMLSALFGIGGGLVMVPFLVIVFGEPQHLAEGTSLAVIVPTALSGAIAHRRHDYVDLGKAAMVAAGGLLAAVVGAVVALNLSSETLGRAFAVVIIFVGARLIRDGLADNSTAG